MCLFAITARRTRSLGVPSDLMANLTTKGPDVGDCVFSFLQTSKYCVAVLYMSASTTKYHPTLTIHHYLVPATIPFPTPLQIKTCSYHPSTISRPDHYTTFSYQPQLSSAPSLLTPPPHPTHEDPQPLSTPPGVRIYRYY